MPLTLLYSSLTKLFLLLLLTLWRPSVSPGHHHASSKPRSEFWNTHHELLQKVLELCDDDKLDREWVVRNVLGGMAAGFGLRGR